MKLLRVQDLLIDHHYYRLKISIRKENKKRRNFFRLLIVAVLFNRFVQDVQVFSRCGRGDRAGGTQDKSPGFHSGFHAPASIIPNLLSCPVHQYVDRIDIALDESTVTDSADRILKFHIAKWRGIQALQSTESKVND